MIRHVFHSSAVLAMDADREVFARNHFVVEVPRFPIGEKP